MSVGITMADTSTAPTKTKKRDAAAAAALAESRAYTCVHVKNHPRRIRRRFFPGPSPSLPLSREKKNVERNSRRNVKRFLRFNYCASFFLLSGENAGMYTVYTLHALQN